jgi:hypothetical protein
MTVEERAKTVTDEVEITTTGAELRVLITQALRDQIEECAKVADKTAKDFTDWNWPDKQRYAPTMAETAESIAAQIRALAEQKSEQEAER